MGLSLRMREIAGLPGDRLRVLFTNIFCPSISLAAQKVVKMNFKVNILKKT